MKSLGYQVGCGFMVGSPYQTSRELARDLEFIADFSPEMCGIGPFIPHRDTPFGDMPAGSAELCLYLLSLLRLIKPTLLLPGDDRARHIAAERTRVGNARRSECNYAKSVAKERAKKVFALQQQAV